jgi:hypothetical protein
VLALERALFWDEGVWDFKKRRKNVFAEQRLLSSKWSQMIEEGPSSSDHVYVPQMMIDCPRAFKRYTSEIYRYPHDATQ